MLTKITSYTFLQLRTIIEQLSEDEFSEKLELLNFSSIGQHVRHVLEFYMCLSKGIKTREVDYDKRIRNLLIENDPKYAIGVLEELSKVFCCEDIEETSLTNTTEFNGVVVKANSSVSRELIYLIEHSIHHYAIIGIALRNHIIHVDIPHNFGVAYSTSQHRKSLEPELVHQY